MKCFCTWHAIHLRLNHPRIDLNLNGMTRINRLLYIQFNHPYTDSQFSLQFLKPTVANGFNTNLPSENIIRYDEDKHSMYSHAHELWKWIEFSNVIQELIIIGAHLVTFKLQIDEALNCICNVGKVVHVIRHSSPFVLWNEWDRCERKCLMCLKCDVNWLIWHVMEL